jgi:hypothetical protein
MRLTRPPLYLPGSPLVAFLAQIRLSGGASEEASRDALDQLAATQRKRAPSIKAVLQAHGLPDVSEPDLAEGRLRATRRRATRRPR